MKNHLFIIFSLFTFSLFAQDKNDKKIFLDSLSKETTEGNHLFYRITKDYNTKKEIYSVTDYYLNNHIKSEELYYNKTGLPFGEHKKFYQSGKLKSNINYSIDDLWAYSSFYENGNKEIEGEFVKIVEGNYTEEVLKINSYWDEYNTQKVVNGNGFMIKRGEFESSRGEIKGGFKNGIWRGTDLKYKIQYVEKYELGKFKGGVSRDFQNIEYAYLGINKQPEFAEGMLKFYEYVKKNYNVPYRDIEKSVKGKVFTSFTVGAEGQIQDVKILRGLTPELDLEAVRLINSTDKPGLWLPAEYRGIKTKASFALPINIEIDLGEDSHPRRYN